MRRALTVAALAVTLFVLAVAPLAHAGGNWNCREISLQLSSKKKISRTVCYPCNPNLLPEATPDLLVNLWHQEVCAPAA